MHSVLSTILAAASLASAAAVAVNPDNFGLTAAHSGSKIHLAAIAATNTSFWIGKATTTYCPPEVSAMHACPPGIDTVFSYSSANKGQLGLDTNVPGGQGVYIGPKGALRFTQAHSGVVPKGSVTDGWTHTQPAKGGNGLGTLTHMGAFLACPEDGAYRVYVAVAGFNAAAHKGCIGFDGLTAKYTTGKPAAWQYQ